MQPPVVYKKSDNKEYKRKRSFSKIIVITIIFAIIFVFINTPYEKKQEIVSIINPLAKKIITQTIFTIEGLQNSEQMEEIVQNDLKNSQGTYAVSIKNLKTGERYYYNEHQEFESASLYKLWIMAETYKQIQQGSFSEEKILSNSIENLNNDFQISSDSAELTDGNLTSSISGLLNNMITFSDNYSAYLLIENIKIANIQNFLDENGLNESKFITNDGNPTTTASDIESFLEKLYKGELANKTYTAEMIDLLKKQQLNGKLPKLLPKDLTIAHKTGELDNFSHDGGIIYSKNGDYIIVIMSNTDDASTANDVIAQISKGVYNYFIK
jgi:beta-lactamase class A